LTFLFFRPVTIEDQTAQEIELDIFEALRQEKRSALSLEFYDREAQTVMNEYVHGFCSLQTFLEDARPPGDLTPYPHSTEMP
jgi:uncharacterized iron-regulated protein